MWGELKLNLETNHKGKQSPENVKKMKTQIYRGPLVKLIKLK